MNKKPILFFFAFVLFAAIAHAQVVRGTVTDPSGAVIQGAHVELRTAKSVVAAAETDRRGTYSLRLPDGSTGPFTLAIHADGFADAERAIDAMSAGPITVAVTLTVSAAAENVNVEATAQSFRDQLDISEVRDSTARDVGEALQAVDGVSKIRKGGIANDLVVRGMQQGNINVQIDGTRIFGACPGHMDPPSQHVDFAEVERVDVLKGPYDVANQGTLGALVNIVTKAPKLGLHLTPTFSAGSSGFYNPALTGGFGNKNFKFLAGYSYRVSDPYTDGSGRKVTSYANYRALGDRSAFDINTGWFETSVTAGNHQFSLGYTRQAAGMVLYPYLSMDSDYDNADRGSFKYAMKDVAGSWRALRVEAYVTRVQHFMSDRLRTSSSATGWKMASDAGTRSIGGRVEADLGRDFTFGVESYWRNWDMFGFSNMGMALTTNRSIPDVNTRTVGSYVDFHHAITDNVKINAGLRFDHASMQVDAPDFNTDAYYLYQNTRSLRAIDNYPSGNARLTARVAKGVELFVGAGSNARIPDAEERYLSRKSSMAVNVGNPNLPATRNTETDAGVTFSRGRAYIKPSIFYSNLSEFIMINEQPRLHAPASGMLPMTARSYTNADARMWGGELAYSFTLTNNLTLNGGGSLTRGTIDRKPQANMFSTNLPEIPPMRTWTAVRYTNHFAFAELGGSAVSRQRRVNTDLSESPTAGYGLMNLKLGVSHKKLYLSFVVDNLLNRYYYEHLSYYRDPFYSGIKVPEPGRNFFGQVRYSF